MPEALTVEILEAAMSAPSAGNQQPWHFVGPGPGRFSARGPADRRFRPCRDARVPSGDGAGLPSCRA
ncbi:MAG: nitroreductase family protein [Bacillota bacterium]